MMRALPNIDFGQPERFVLSALHQAGAEKAHLATHALGVALLGAYAILMTWLIASSLANMRPRKVVRAAVAVAFLGALYAGSTARAQAGGDPVEGCVGAECGSESRVQAR
jgi:hypothetical protein